MIPTNGAKSFAQSQSADSIDWPICRYVSGTTNIKKSSITFFLNSSDAFPKNSPVTPELLFFFNVTCTYCDELLPFPEIIIAPLEYDMS